MSVRTEKKREEKSRRKQKTKKAKRSFFTAPCFLVRREIRLFSFSS